MPKNVKRFGIYWFDPNPTKGSELNKIRPCVVVSPDEVNNVLKTAIVVPLTSTIKPWPYRISVRVMKRPCGAACDQLRVVDKSRLKEYIEDLSPAESDRLLTLLQTMFAK